MSAHLEQLAAFAAYNREFNERIYRIAAEIDDAERRADRGAFFGSIHATLNHILLADRIWLGRFAASPPGFRALDGAALVERFESLGDELYADFDALAAARRETDAVIERWCAELTDERLAAPFRYANSKGEAREHPLWIAAAHLFNHQTHHRGQITTLLSQAGRDPGVTDFLYYAVK